MAESQESFQEKTEQPTPKRLRDSRQQGNVAQSADFGSAAVLVAGIAALMLMGKWMIGQLIWCFRAVYFEMPTVELNQGTFPAYVFLGFVFLAKLLGPFMLTLAVIALISRLLQTGFIWSAKPLQPQLSKLSPKSNIKRLLGVRGLVELAKGILKILIVAWIAYFTIKSEIGGFVTLIDQDIAAIISAVGIAALKLAVRVTAALIILALLDYAFQKWKHKHDMKMTRQEVKDERRQTEGDPAVKSRIRDVQLKTSFNRMIGSIPKADVVIANPIHVAVALRYDMETMTAPKVVAKGARKLALRIKEIARENDVPVFEEPELARALFKSVEVGWEIPYDLYRAVAEVLALVYKLKEAA